MNEQINTGEILIYQTEDGEASLEVKLIKETVWLNLNQMAGLFQRNKSVVSRHISNVFRTGELSKRATGRTVYILDEPTTGLHFADIKKLIEVLNSLVEKGNTVIVIEHNLDVIKTADWIIDLGPEGGDGGGLVVAEGTPEEVVKVKGSYTGKFLKRVLK